MARSKAATVKEYLSELPAERRSVISAVRDVIIAHLPKGYRETINWGMIVYEVPLEQYPDTYNGQPLCYIALGAQKNHYAVYLPCVYQGTEKAAWLRNEFKKAGKKLDMGKACVRFRKLEDLPPEAIAKVVGESTPEAYIKRVEAIQQAYRSKKT
jgi:hypothetical protein